ncbi:MAG TPA: hypothetical protein VK540_03355 [Polyangiaceae bacterium]|jgi:hypothetical protein|nr:hypothetical protein [Polyangiaceae bacterium]
MAETAAAVRLDLNAPEVLEVFLRDGADPVQVAGSLDRIRKLALDRSRIRE